MFAILLALGLGWSGLLIGFACIALGMRAVGMRDQKERERFKRGAWFMKAVTGLCFPLTYWKYGWTGELLLGLSLVSFLVLVTVADLADRRIPNGVLLPFCLSVLLLRGLFPYQGSDFSAQLIGAAGVFLLLLLIAVVTDGAIGGGDVKLYGVIGLFLPPDLLVWAMIYSSVSGGLYGLALLIAGRASCQSKLPFAPWIAFGTLVAYFSGDRFA